MVASLAYVRFDQDGDNDLYFIAMDILRVAKSIGLGLDVEREDIPAPFRAKIDATRQQHFDNMAFDTEYAANELLKRPLGLGGLTFRVCCSK